MPSGATVQTALQGLTASLNQRQEVRRFQQARARIEADPAASRELHAFITECYSRARSGAADPSALDAHWLAARREAACRNPVVKAYLQAQEDVLRLLASVRENIQNSIVAPHERG